MRLNIFPKLASIFNVETYEVQYRCLGPQHQEWQSAGYACKALLSTSISSSMATHLTEKTDGHWKPEGFGPFDAASQSMRWQLIIAL